MSIREDAKKIIQYMLNIAISQGDLYEHFFIGYDVLAKELGLENEKYCRICCQYLDQLNYIKIIRNDGGLRLIELKAKGIEFLESM